jgi:hypothetical protein
MKKPALISPNKAMHEITFSFQLIIAFSVSACPLFTKRNK